MDDDILGYLDNPDDGLPEEVAANNLSADGEPGEDHETENDIDAHVEDMIKEVSFLSGFRFCLIHGLQPSPQSN
jgi:hypothetical protein